jgi:NAD(P)-dependent dehydrogenase (short-subunit alcohol dehydrogenase family)
MCQTGGANGIGAATTQLLYEQGANVVFGDLNEDAGNKLVQQLSSDSAPRVNFLKTDVANYESLLALFEFAFEKYGRIDHALPFAGIVEIGNWFDPSLDLSSIRKVIHATKNQPI